MFDVYQALDFLKNRSLPVTPMAALEYLQHRRINFVLLNLYAQQFPEDFALSVESCYAQPGTYHSPREQEFFHLVETRLFSFFEDYEMGLDGEEPCLEFTPRWHGFLPYCEPQELPLAEYAALPFASYYDYVGIDPDNYQRQFGLSLSAIVEASQDIRPEVILNVFQETSKPISHFLKVWLYLQGETGIMLLDANDETIIAPHEWNLENLAFFAREHEEAMAYLAQMNCFAELLQANPKRVMHQVFHLWNRAASISRSQPRPLAEALITEDTDSIALFQEEPYASP